jgi:hypothetical protein
MGTITRAIPLGPTDGEGAFNRTVPNLVGAVRAIGVVLNTLDSPDLDVVDALTEAVILDVDAVAADTLWQPVVPQQGTDGVDVEYTVDNGDSGTSTVKTYASPVLLRGLTVTVASGGAAKTGTLYVTLER